MLRARPRRLPRRLRGWTLNRLVPNGLTVMALCAGLTSIRFALEARWELAVLAIAAAAVLDGLDGRAARLLKGTSRFGAELDSLADFISFGAAPAVLIYEWSLVGLKGFGWTIALLFAVCCALRLARFNSEIEAGEEAKPSWTRPYFKGVPAPAGAGLALLPVMLWLEFGADLLRSSFLSAPVMIAVALAMISQLPTFSLKRYTVPHRYVLPVLLLVGVLFAALASAPWATLTFFGIAYLASLPVAFVFERRQQRRQPVAAETPPPAAASPAAAPPTSALGGPQPPGVVVAIPPRPSARG